MTTANPESILDSVKKTLGFDPDYTAFDVDIILHINSAFGSLLQLGAGPDGGFLIQDNTTLWLQYTTQLSYLGMIQQYVYLSVRLAFDPPDGRFGLSAIQDQLHQLEWRINVQAENAGASTDEAVIVVNLAYAATVTPDASVANTFYLTLTGDCTINAPVDADDGKHITMQLIANNHVVTWGSGWNFGQPGEPVLSTDGSTDVISAVYAESVNEWYAGYTIGF